MELGLILLFAGFVIAIYILIASRISRNRGTKRIWSHQKNQPRIRAVGPCAVAVGAYKTYEDRKQIEKLQSKFKSGTS